MTAVAEPQEEATTPAIVPGSVALMYCTRGECRFEFAQSLVGIVNQPLEGHPLKYVLGRIASGNLAVHRNEVVADFLALDAEWLWMVDDDMQIAPDVLEKLFDVVEHTTNIFVVGGLYANVGLDGGVIPMTYYYSDDNRVENYSAANIGRMILKGAKSAEVDSTGAGCLLVHRSVFEVMLEKWGAPMAWFANDLIPDASGKLVVQGEDHTFFRRVREIGHKVHVRLDVDIAHFKPIALTNDQLVELSKRADKDIDTAVDAALAAESD